jgi:hypothetical protein
VYVVRLYVAKLYFVYVVQDDNLMDVLKLAVELMAEHPMSMVPTFDKKGGIRCVTEMYSKLTILTLRKGHVYEDENPYFIRFDEFNSR